MTIMGAILLAFAAFCAGWISAANLWHRQGIRDGVYAGLAMAAEKGWLTIRQIVTLEREARRSIRVFRQGGTEGPTEA